jgi:hypothetical protein
MAQPVAYLVRVMIERISFGLPLGPLGMRGWLYVIYFALFRS